MDNIFGGSRQNPAKNVISRYSKKFRIGSAVRMRTRAMGRRSSVASRQRIKNGVRQSSAITSLVSSDFAFEETSTASVLQCLTMFTPTTNISIVVEGHLCGAPKSRLLAVVCHWFLLEKFR